LVTSDHAPPAASSPGCPALCGGLRREPDVRQELVEFSWGVDRQAADDVLKMREWINDVVRATACHGE
jgi:hypothetical protein